jgi:hypothetical protein
MAWCWLKHRGEYTFDYQGPSWEADSRLTGQNVPQTLWNVKVH